MDLKIKTQNNSTILLQSLIFFFKKDTFFCNYVIKKRYITPSYYFAFELSKPGYLFNNGICCHVFVINAGNLHREINM